MRREVGAKEPGAAQPIVAFLSIPLLLEMSLEDTRIGVRGLGTLEL